MIALGPNISDDGVTLRRTGDMSDSEVPMPPMSAVLFAPRTYAEKRVLAKRRAAKRIEEREMTAAGYRKHETDWEIHRGDRYREVIIDAKVSADGKYVWTKLGVKS